MKLNEFAVDRLVSGKAEPPPVDLAQLRELTGDDAEFISSIAESFSSSCAELVAELRAGAASGDASQVSRAAHAIKGSSANLYAEKLRILAEQLEHQSFSRPELEAKILEITREVQRVSTVLEGLAANGLRLARGSAF